MKNKILIINVFIVIMLTASSLVSSHNISLNDKNSKIEINEKENKSYVCEPTCIRIATLHVKVLDRHGNPCPNTSVKCLRWIGLFLLPVFFGILQLPITFLKSKYTDENGICTINIILFFNPQGGYGWFPFSINAYKDGLSSGTLTQLVPGANNITIRFPNDHGLTKLL